MLAIINGRVITMTGKEYEKGTILTDGQKIAKVGSNISIPEGAEVIDAAGKIVMPGLIDAHCHVGILEEVYRQEGNDVNESTEPVTPHLRAIDGINPEDLGFQDALEGGVTTVVTGPGSGNVIGGENLAMKTFGRVVDEMVIKNPIGLKVAFGENPKRVYGSQSKMPMTRMATAALFREALVKAENYMAKMERQRQRTEEAFFERDLKMEVLCKVLKREIPIRAHAHRADDIMTAIRIAEEFNLKIIIEHCTEGYKVADQLAKRGIPAVVGPFLTNRAKVELKDRTLANPYFLAKAGVKIAFMTDHPVIPINYLALSAALAVREGLDEQEAMKALTVNAAQILGLQDRIGTLEPGKDADIIILNGPLFELKTRVEKVIVAGKIINLDSK
ncbi:amidohydrolase [Thermincola ferriacetica]|uniref:Amidohydrolase n=1 Tax=Thermincola ferriacetica TaxID=281456 RepID=A0A0L6W326_9FIRM|nr:amidohydrolase [Thermincola ferriacetica]KNZ69881.1 amidohydrolase [Thermincola ferriacetica]